MSPTDVFYLASTTFKKFSRYADETQKSNILQIFISTKMGIL